MADFTALSDARQLLLNQLFQQYLNNHYQASVFNGLQGQNQHFSPPAQRPPSTLNPFGLPHVGAAPGALSPHLGPGWTMGQVLTAGGGGHSPLQLAGQTGPGAPGARNWFGPPGGGAGGPGGPHFIPPAQRPPSGLGPLPGH